MLWLVGMMGSGKSTVGAAVAKRVGCGFVDMDRVLEARWGAISQQWEDGGEGGFRRREAELVLELASKGDEKLVISTGGGAVLSSTSVALMQDSGMVVWLRARPETLRMRISEGSERPLLAERQIDQILDDRLQTYASSADLVIDTDDLDVRDVVERVVSAWS